MWSILTKEMSKKGHSKIMTIIMIFDQLDIVKDVQ